MGADQTIDWANAAASALDWWREAGVDTVVEDAGFDWLARVAPPAPASAPAATALPSSLLEFAAWRIGEAAPEAAWGGSPIAASGPSDAALMILVDCPERDDRKRLLEGAAGRLFDRMLAAIGFDRAQVRLASVCVTRPTAGRMPRATEQRLSEIARHHVALTSPPRLLLLGNAASRALLATELSEARGRLHALNHQAGTTSRVVATFHPRFLLEKPACKAEAWRDLQMLMGDAA